MKRRNFIGGAAAAPPHGRSRRGRSRPEVE
jgi:hypothetical protein